MNKTGMATSPALAKEMLAEAKTVQPTSEGSKETLSLMCTISILEAEPIGSIPVPHGMSTGDAKTLLFTDKLGERLAFERSGIRLWEGFLTKFQALPTQQGDIDIDEIHRMHIEELEHFLILKEAAESLGADPTAITPAANVSGVASLGLMQVITDPRTNLDQCLQALIMAELTDNDGWKMLTELARSLGHTALVKKFEKAHKQEDQHLGTVRSWILSRALTIVKEAA